MILLYIDVEDKTKCIINYLLTTGRYSALTIVVNESLSFSWTNKKGNDQKAEGSTRQ